MDGSQSFSGTTAVADDDCAVDAPPVIGTDERRMHVRAYNYWVSLLNGHAYPSVDQLDFSELGDFGPNSVLLDFTQNPEVPDVAWLGEKLRGECGVGADVKSVADVPARSLLSRLTDHHLQIIANRAPIGFEAEFVNARGNNTMYRGILLPFSSDTDTIDYIYGVINWKENADDRIAQAVVAELAAQPRLSVTSPARPMIPVWADGPRHVERAAASQTVQQDDSGAALAAEDEDVALADLLRALRANAYAAQSADGRSRAALYQALDGAYDFALRTDSRPEEYAALLAQSRIAVQARAPMTPIAKLVFGNDYDKTRLTEFAAALSFGRRRALPAGGMKLFLENYPGGLKAIVAAERRERRPADKPVKPDATRERARDLAEQAYLTLPGNDEFVVMVARRVDADRVAIIGVVPDDRALLDRALRQIVE